MADVIETHGEAVLETFRRKFDEESTWRNPWRGFFNDVSEDIQDGAEGIAVPGDMNSFSLKTLYKNAVHEKVIEPSIFMSLDRKFDIAHYLCPYDDSGNISLKFVRKIAQSIAHEFLSQLDAEVQGLFHRYARDGHHIHAKDFGSEAHKKSIAEAGQVIKQKAIDLKVREFLRYVVIGTNLVDVLENTDIYLDSFEVNFNPEMEKQESTMYFGAKGRGISYGGRLGSDLKLSISSEHKALFLHGTMNYGIAANQPSCMWLVKESDNTHSHSV